MRNVDTSHNLLIYKTVKIRAKVYFPEWILVTAPLR